ncbi:hypothetical protein [Nocardioides salarius]|uniref:hypothetical protein n=1 Tax=Nocardioides salarius TaxID=374513 RepID=UPI0030FA410B
MSFSVRTDSLRSARNRLRALSDDTDVARGYAADHLRITGADDGVFFAHVEGVNADVVSRLDTLLGRLKDVLSESGEQLGAVARYYDRSDESAVSRADQELSRLEGAGPTFADVPAVADTTPEDPGDYVPSEHGSPEAPDDEMLMAPGPFTPPGLDAPASGGGVA